MKELLTDLYKKLAGFFQNAPEEKENVKEVACNRLKLVLMQDRTNLTPQLLERMRGELIDLLSRYVEMDKEALELNFAHEGDSMALMLSIPVLRAKDEEEIQAILDEEEAAKEAADDEAEETEVTEDSEDSEEDSLENIDENVDEAEVIDSEEADESEVCSCQQEETDVECDCEECECGSKQESNESVEKKSKKNKK